MVQCQNGARASASASARCIPSKANRVPIRRPGANNADVDMPPLVSRRHAKWLKCSVASGGRDLRLRNSEVVYPITRWRL